MQKTAPRKNPSKTIYSLLVTIVVWVFALIGIVTTIFLWSVFAADTNWWKFWAILNAILASGNWENSDGTVKNALKLGGKDATAFQQIGTDRSCPENQCIYWFDSSNNVLCR